MKNIKVAEPVVGKEELKALEDVLYSGCYVSGPKVSQFETDFANYSQASHGVAVNSGTAALHIALACLDIGPGDEVIVPALTFFSTATAVIHQNAIPIFADINPKTYNIDPEDVLKRITDKTKAIIPVHYFGYPAEMDQINEIAKEHGLYVIEDCAQAHGAEYKNKKVGSLGDCGCFSFFATKNMTTGEGGMITTNNQELAHKAKLIRSHGMEDRNTHSVLGYNYRMNEFAAAIGIEQLKKLDSFNEKRRQYSHYLFDKIKDIDWLEISLVEDYVKHVYFWCPVLIDEEKLGMTTLELRGKLNERGIGTRHRYLAPLNKQKMLVEKNCYPKGCPFSCPYYGKEIDYTRFSYPQTEKVAGKMLGLPNHPRLTQEELDYIIEVLHSVK